MSEQNDVSGDLGSVSGNRNDIRGEHGIRSVSNHVSRRLGNIGGRASGGHGGRVERDCSIRSVSNDVT